MEKENVSENETREQEMENQKLRKKVPMLLSDWLTSLTNEKEQLL